MSKKVLVLHSSDSTARAKIFKEWLTKQGFSPTILGDLSRPESASVYTLLQESIKSHDTVAVLVSHGVFKSCVLRFAIAYALGTEKRLISIIKESEPVILPTWYASLFEIYNHYNDGEIWFKLKKL